VIGLAGQDRVGTEDLLLGLVAADTEECNTAFGSLDLLGIEYIPVRRLLGRDQPSPAGRMPPTAEVVGMLSRAAGDAQQAGRDQVGTAELLLAVLTQTEAAGGGVVAGLLAQLGAAPGLLRGWNLEARTDETGAGERSISRPAATAGSGAEPGPTSQLTAAPRQDFRGGRVRLGIRAAWRGARHRVRGIRISRATSGRGGAR
jgi:hypothetical protein